VHNFFRSAKGCAWNVAVAALALVSGPRARSRCRREQPFDIAKTTILSAFLSYAKILARTLATKFSCARCRTRPRNFRRATAATGAAYTQN